MRDGELQKELINQTRHAIWGAATGIVPVVGCGQWAYLCLVAACLSGWFWTRRERIQLRKGSREPWDPALDNAIFWVAASVGSCLTISII